MTNIFQYQTYYKAGYEQFLSEIIQIAQFPDGKELSLSEGKIIKLNNNNKYKFCHKADTKHGSSGSPIFLKGDYRILGIHSAGNEDKRINCGYFIGPAIDFMKKFKRNGEGIEFYKMGR